MIQYLFNTYINNTFFKTLIKFNKIDKCDKFVFEINNI